MSCTTWSDRGNVLRGGSGFGGNSLHPHHTDKTSYHMRIPGPQRLIFQAGGLRKTMAGSAVGQMGVTTMLLSENQESPHVVTVRISRAGGCQ